MLPMVCQECAPVAQWRVRWSAMVVQPDGANEECHSFGNGAMVAHHHGAMADGRTRAAVYCDRQGSAAANGGV